MKRARLIGGLVDDIAARRACRIAIDGRSAAGKSVLAAELAEALRAAGPGIVCMSMDGFHHPPERRHRQGRLSPRGYLEDAFDTDAVARAVEAVPASTMLVFEGIFAFRSQLDALWDYRVLVDTDFPATLERALARDVGVIGTAAEVRAKYELRYEPAWQMYIAGHRPAGKADVVISRGRAQAQRLEGQEA